MFASEGTLKIGKQNGRHTELKNGHKDGIEVRNKAVEEATQKTNEKLLYLFSPDHRASLRREEQEKIQESQLKQTPVMVITNNFKRPTKVESSPGQILEKILTKEDLLTTKTEKGDQKIANDQKKELR